MKEEPESLPRNGDPLTEAAKRLFALPYLFPYQRLVISNILEAAEASGVPVHWTADAQAAPVPPSGDSGPPSGDAGPPAGDADPDDLFRRESPGRQIVILPTGAGKSLCFQLPAMLMEGPTLVIFPILGLMADQERRLLERGLSPAVLRGGQTAGEREEIWRRVRTGQSAFIIANPEVLLVPSVLAELKNAHIVHIVIDEAHCVSEWGESFRPAYLAINTIITAAAPPIVTAFTATASAPVLEKIENYIFGGEGAHMIRGNPDRTNIAYSALGCVLRDLAVRDLLLSLARPAIVFCSSRRGTEKLAGYLRGELREQGAPWWKEIRFYHAGLSREEKKDVEGWYLYNPDGVLVSTCAFGLGMDKADIRTVLHRDCPPSVEAYLQESGRAGRDGLASRALLLWGPDDQRYAARAETPAGRTRLAALLHYARDTHRCRRDALLEMLDYEGGRESPGASCCDVCEKKASPALREETPLLAFFEKNRRAFTTGEAASVLAPAGNLRWPQEDARRAVAHLVKAGTVKKLNSFLWKNKLTLPAAKRPGRSASQFNIPNPKRDLKNPPGVLSGGKGPPCGGRFSPCHPLSPLPGLFSARKQSGIAAKLLRQKA
ncbi:MAG: RecQ family ATP-dependent DNA helicase [Treponema sp.]|jgi:ATP-dependent DNA helicase RecQ|nr:RecQ family ATP-dependent DNA helicase [Treponema sp.]